MVQATELAMGPRPTTLLGLVLCLAQPIWTQNGALPKPSISAKPGLVLHRGQPVTIVCQGPAGAHVFRLEDNDRNVVCKDQTIKLQPGSQWTEARFLIPALSEVKARNYRCLYHDESTWSVRSDPLELKVADEDVSTPPSGSPRVSSSTLLSLTSTPSSVGSPRVSSSTLLSLTSTPSSVGLRIEHIYILVGVAVAFLLCLFLLVLLLVHRQHQKKKRSPGGKGEEVRPQERFSPTVSIADSTADVATVDALPERHPGMHSLSPDSEDPQEVTYAQLDQRALTMRPAQAQSSQPTDPRAESSMYSVFARR